MKCRMLIGASLVVAANALSVEADVVTRDVRLDDSQVITIDPGSVVGELTTWDTSHATVNGGIFGVSTRVQASSSRCPSRP